MPVSKWALSCVIVWNKTSSAAISARVVCQAKIINLMLTIYGALGEHFRSDGIAESLCRGLGLSSFLKKKLQKFEGYNSNMLVFWFT